MYKSVANSKCVSKPWPQKILPKVYEALLAINKCDACREDGPKDNVKQGTMKRRVACKQDGPRDNAKQAKSRAA